MSGASRGRALAALGALAALAACQRTPGAAIPSNVAQAGVSIAIYDRAGGHPVGIVDDRRWIDLAGDTLDLDRVDPRAELSSLVIEPLAGGALDVGSCLRDRLPPASVDALTPVLRCHARGAPGRHLVRLLYVVPGLGFRARHELAMTAPDRATVVSRFAIVTPVLLVRGELALFDGFPGSEQPPRELARGPALLDGGTAVLALPPRLLSAALRRVYRGAVIARGDDAVSPRELAWAQRSQPAVWVWLELGEHHAPGASDVSTGFGERDRLNGPDGPDGPDGPNRPGGPGRPDASSRDGRARAALAPGTLHVHLEIAGEPVRDVDVPAATGERTRTGLRMPLWIDDQLHGRRERRSTTGGDAAISDHFQFSIANLGSVPREVWIEEPLRPAARPTVSRAWPTEPAIVDHQLRMMLTVPPGKLERAGFEVAYDG